MGSPERWGLVGGGGEREAGTSLGMINKYSNNNRHHITVHRSKGNNVHYTYHPSLV